ncbi:MAG: TIGR03936 family radical SAM-associated protein [Oscillospiraceae bacterium]|nr:TIGR03936 family radical SAM-associated protein [Oscillospiraceae bacterium]
MKDYRIIFEKKDNMKYISHLDLNRCMIRSVRRSGLPAWYTEGFHPHLYLMFPLALSLGTESICEVMDLRLTEEVSEQEILEKLNSALPKGLHAICVREPDNQAQDITSAEYILELSSPEIADLKSCWLNFFHQPEILTQKRTKKGMREIDIKPVLKIEKISTQDNKLKLILKLPAGNDGNINTSVVIDAFKKYAGKPILINYLCRTKIFCKNSQEFL